MNKENEKIFADKIKETIDANCGGLPFGDELDFESKSVFIANKKKKGRGYRRGAYIAAAAAFILVFSSLFGVMLANGTVEAVRTDFLNYVYEKTGNEHKVSNQPYSLTVDSPDDKAGLKKAADIIPGLVYFDEIPDGYSFDYMIVEKFEATNAFSVTEYVNSEDNRLTIHQTIADKEKSVLDIHDVSKEENIRGGKLLVSLDIDGEKGLNCVSYAKDSTLISIFGKMDENFLSRFMKEKIIPEL